MRLAIKLALGSALALGALALELLHQTHVVAAPASRAAPARAVGTRAAPEPDDVIAVAAPAPRAEVPPWDVGPDGPPPPPGHGAAWKVKPPRPDGAPVPVVVVPADPLTRPPSLEATIDGARPPR